MRRRKPVTAVELLRRNNMQAQADGAERAIAKLRALMTRQTAARIEPDLEVLTEAEGLAMRPGPKPKINQAILCSLRQAIITQRKVRLHYLYRTTRRRGYQTVHPYGYQSGYLADFLQLRGAAYTSQPLYRGEDAGDSLTSRPTEARSRRSGRRMRASSSRSRS